VEEAKALMLQHRTRRRLAQATSLAAALLVFGVVPAAAQPGPPGPTGPVETLVGVTTVPTGPSEGEGPPDGMMPPVPARFSEPLGPFAMHVETLASAGPSEYGLLATPGCVSDSVYKRGMKLIFRFEVYDLDNKVRVTSADQSTASVLLPTGETLEAAFFPRAGPGQPIDDAVWTWVAVWQIPPDYPLGPVVYSIDVATPDGRAASLTPPSIAGQPVRPGVPLAVAGTFPTIIP
jgi:hypothetical protein